MSKKTETDTSSLPFLIVSNEMLSKEIKMHEAYRLIMDIGQ